MRTPPGLSAAARREWREAVAALRGRNVELEQFAGALASFARAVDRRLSARTAWDEEGCPWTTHGGATGLAEVPHPLARLVGEAERDEARARATLGLDPASSARIAKRPAGRPMGATSADDRTTAPPRVTRLKAVP